MVAFGKLESIVVTSVASGDILREIKQPENAECQPAKEIFWKKFLEVSSKLQRKLENAAVFQVFFRHSCGKIRIQNEKVSRNEKKMLQGADKTSLNAQILGFWKIVGTSLCYFELFLWSYQVVNIFEAPAAPLHYSEVMLVTN